MFANAPRRIKSDGPAEQNSTSDNGGLPEQVLEGADEVLPRGLGDGGAPEAAAPATVESGTGSATAAHESLDVALTVTPIWEPETSEAVDLSVNAGPMSISTALSAEQARELIDELERALETAESYTEGEEEDAR